MRTLLLTATITLASMASAQFSSGFEIWTDTVPSDWMGSKTTLSADSVQQVSTDVHGGSYAARLTSMSSSHKRFTTQPVTVVEGTIYEISFWVRGTGNIRTGLYDGRTSGSGYASYNAYVNSTGNSWTQVVQQITCANDTDAAQFILSVQLTAGPEHLVVDDVNITSAGGPTPASIYAIQYTTAPDGASPLANQIVLTGGIVTGVDTIGQNSYFIQAGTGPWSGIYVFDAASVVNIGDSVVLQATVQEYQGVTELGAVTGLTVVGQYPVPQPQLLDTYLATQEQWEGVLAVLANVTCTSLPDGFGEWGVSQVSGAYLADDLMFVFAPEVGSAYDITGCIHYANANWKIEPRFAADIVEATGINEAIAIEARVFPNPTEGVLYVENTNGLGVDFVMMDAVGRTVASDVLSRRITLVNTDALAAGIYQVVVRNANAVSVHKVVVR